MFSLAGKFCRHVVPSVIKPLRVMWNQVIGLLFISFAVVSARYVYTSYTSLDGGAESFFRFALSGFFGALMLYFGLSSFWRARRISRS